MGADGRTEARRSEATCLLVTVVVVQIFDIAVRYFVVV